MRKVGFRHAAVEIRSGLIACTGNCYCKFAQANTKGHALALADYLEKKLKLDQPVNIHLTGCPNSCAQHYMGDIGLLGTKVKGRAKASKAITSLSAAVSARNQAVGRQVFSAIRISRSLQLLLEKMLRGYLRQRECRREFPDVHRAA